MQWDKISEGTPSAYYGTCLAGFPNFFMMMGPNTVTGHLSVIYTVECQINFTMRVIKPIIQSMQPSKPFLPFRSSLDKVVVSAQAQRQDNTWIQEKAKELVWATGCTSWFIEPKTGRNTQMYPDWQYKFWARSIFIPWQDFRYGKSRALQEEETRNPQSWISTLGKSLVAVTACYAVGSAFVSFPDLQKEAFNLFKDPMVAFKSLLIVKA